MEFTTIKNLLFDLGAVIVEIDVDAAFNRFLSYSNLEKDVLFEKIHHLNEQFERDEMSRDEFRKNIKNELGLSIDDILLDQLWNSVITYLPPARIEKLILLKEKYKLYLLSNTNRIHIDFMHEMLSKQFNINKLDDLFTIAFYSYDLKLRKPDIKIYESVLEKANIKAHETIFLDDNFANITEAAKTGLHTMHVTPEKSMLDYLEQAL